ncbi:MAG TPA: protein kinase [Polyangiaceae bacterium]|nr:protein kinase [Polyangiaceae bacterium]
MSDESTTIEPGTVLAGRYRVEERLGQGGMGSVFLVQHMHTDQRLALKVLHSTIVSDAVALDRFRREARAPARVQSDHVVQVTDADVAPELGGVPFLVMEWLRGEDLEKLSSRGALPFPEVVLYLRQAARALDKAHAIGIIHRDLKPENLFLTTREDGTPWIKLLDFGIAKLTGASGDLAHAGSATSTGQIFGTPLFMSPEQAKAETDKISPQTDIWALGLIAYRLLTGKDFWTAQTLTHLVAQIAYEPIPPPSNLGVKFGPAYDTWFLKCCARDPKDRFASAGEAVTALAEALGVNEASSGFDGRASRPSGTSKKDKHAETIAFAATAHDSGVLAESAAGAAKAAAPPEVTPNQRGGEKPQRGRKVATAAAFAIAVGAVGIWLAVSRGEEPEEGTPGTPVNAAGPDGISSGAPTNPPVVVTPSATAQEPPPPEKARLPEKAGLPEKAAPTSNAAAPKPEPSAPDGLGSRKQPPPRVTGAASKPPAPPPTTPPPKTEDDPLGTRH